MVSRDWVPPRALLVSASAGDRVPAGDMLALREATDHVEAVLERCRVLPYEGILAVEVTVRYSAKARSARLRVDRSAPQLACFVVDEPIEDMLTESVPALTRRFVRALTDCLRAGAIAGKLPADAVDEAISAAGSGALTPSSDTREPSPAAPDIMDDDSFWRVVSLLNQGPDGTAAAAAALSSFDIAGIAMFDVLLERRKSDLADAPAGTPPQATEELALGIIGLGKATFDRASQGDWPAQPPRSNELKQLSELAVRHLQAASEFSD